MAISLSKGSGPVSLSKGTTLTARVTWPNATDYDLGAEVLYADGRTESIAQFPADGLPAQPQSRGGKIVQTGDEGRGSGTMSEEVLQISLTDDILAVVPWAYSAQSNGTGSFFRYRVSMEVSDGHETVRIDAASASNDDRVYTCVPGMITNLPGEGPRVHYLELYSASGSENRPKVRWGSPKGGLFRKASGPAGVQIDMNAGPRNQFK